MGLRRRRAGDLPDRHTHGTAAERVERRERSARTEDPGVAARARTFLGDELEFVGAIVAPSGRAALIDRGIADLATKKITLPEVYGDWLEGGTFLPERTSANPTVGAP